MSAQRAASAALRGLLRRRGAQFSAQRHRSTHSAEEPLDLVRLTTQIREFSALCEPSDEEAAARRDTHARLREIVVPKARLHVFGSSVTGLGLPGADVDCAVENRRLRSERSRSEALRSLARAVSDEHIARRGSLEVIAHARVPIVTYTDRRSGLRVDVTVNALNGVRNTALLSSALAQRPQMRGPLRVLKAFLRQRAGWHETFHGGIGSYLLFAMMLRASSGPLRSHRAFVKGLVDDFEASVRGRPYPLLDERGSELSGAIAGGGGVDAVSAVHDLLARESAAEAARARGLPYPHARAAPRTAALALEVAYGEASPGWSCEVRCSGGGDAAGRTFGATATTKRSAKQGAYAELLRWLQEREAEGGGMEPPPREDGSVAEEEAPPVLAADAEGELLVRFLRTYGRPPRGKFGFADPFDGDAPDLGDKAHRFSTIAGGFERALDGLHESGGDLGAVLDEWPPQEAGAPPTREDLRFWMDSSLHV